MTRDSVRHRFWIEVTCAGLGTVLFVVTLFSREWVELVFGVDPDGGSGALEFAIAIGLLAVAALSALLARHEWQIAAGRR